MDSLTHTVLGACLGEAIAGKKIGKKAMLWGAIANNVPDIDVITGIWMNQADSLLAHRGFTHSILFLFLAAPALAWLFRKKYAASGMQYKDWLLIWGSGILIHLFIDALTAYGTGWFEPFSHYRVSFNVLFVADPFYTIALLISAIALLILKKTNLHRMKWANFALVISTIYIGYALFHKFQVDKISRDNFQEKSISTTDYFSTPTPLNNFLWYIVANTDDGYEIAYYSVFDKSKDLTFNFYPRRDSLLIAYKDNEEVQKLIRFSAGYYTIEQKGDTVQFSDLRFGQIGGWSSPQVPFVFRYYLNENANNDLLIQQGRIDASKRDGIRSLVERIKGI
ncbi:MAG: metal-dependent hydrolase [Bacteroidetes bacterium]|nr:MAG: metal-dependent hydrolase [Bacteroidota bacterium]